MPEKLRKNYCFIIYSTIFAILFLFIASLFSFYILQSDDYYYASFFKGGLSNFLKLTVDHYHTINGRAFVHFFAHCAMAFPTFITGLISTLILFLISHFSAKTLIGSKTKTHYVLFNILFYSFIMMSGRNILKESLMWMSGFYNYVFPLLVVVLMLYFRKKQNYLWYGFAFLSGATTEQWGFGAIVILSVLLICAIPKNKGFKTLLIHFTPVVLSVLGLATIYLSPATCSRIALTTHTTPDLLLSDFSRMAEVFFNRGSGVLVILLFIAATTSLSFVLKKSFKVLYSGFIPLFFVGFSEIHWLSFFVLIIYIVICLVVLLKEKYILPAALLSGALAMILIMLPTNTFEARITFAPIILLGLCAIIFVFELKLSQKVMLPSVIAVVLLSVFLFIPSYMGFYKNHLVEKKNLAAVETAKVTKTLNYSIDYDKNFAMRQMFNDGWFFNKFLSLYNIEDCAVTMDSKDAKHIYHMGSKLNVKALCHEGEYYVPIRALLEEAGGSISTEENIVMTLNDKTLSYVDSALIYLDSSNQWQYLVADDNKLYDFYTLYIKLSVINNAFQTNFATK